MDTADIDNTDEHELLCTRRALLARTGMGFAALGLAGLVGPELRANRPIDAAPSDPVPGTGFSRPLATRNPHFRPRAKHVIHLFMNGGPSHVDTFDPKPALAAHAGKLLPTANLRTERKTGAALPSPFAFRQYGESGIEVSDLFRHVGAHIDDIAVVRSMHADVPNHEPSLLLMNCGEARLVRPSVGSWVTYGLGTENENLPGFVCMCPGGYPIQETQNWQSGFLPGVFQGTHVDTRHTKIDKLIEHIENRSTRRSVQRRQLDALRRLNEEHARRRAHDAALEARIHSFELAYRMQIEASDAFDVDREPESIKKLYGVDAPGGTSLQARQMIIARRLIERGVRYVQVWHGAGQPWDSHDDLDKNHSRLARQCDQPIAALLEDLKLRGLLDETLVIWGGEFGRTPTVELPKPGSNQGRVNGRDHNHHGFTMWLAGGGVRGGQTYGATDEFGFRAEVDRTHVHDLHATMLHLLGFDHERLTYRFAGRDFRLTDVHGNVIDRLIS